MILITIIFLLCMAAGLLGSAGHNAMASIVLMTALFTSIQIWKDRKGEEEDEEK